VHGGRAGAKCATAFALTVGLALAGVVTGSAATESVSEQKVRRQRIEDAVLAPCCYAEPVSRHASEVAVKMRLEIARWVAEGRTDQEILDTYVRQYGAKVLVDPRTIPAWWTPWIPWLIAIMGILLGFCILRRWHNKPHAVGLPPDAETPELPDFDDED
jgi:cytochrome c-type biogenesis protein CcmH/NrfF